MYYHLKLANEQAQKELIDIKNKLFHAQKEGLIASDQEKAPITKDDLKQKILLANEDLSLENPVDLQLFEEIKILR